MFTDLIDIFTLLATLPNRGVVLTEAAFVIVASLFALELAAPLIVLAGLIVKAAALIVLKASALPHARLNAGRALPRPLGARRAHARIAAAATAVWPAADEASDRVGSLSAPHPIDELARANELARAIGEAQSWRDPTDGP
jgi:hypothetical protein